MTSQYMSNQSDAAKMIRTILKAKFPTIKFSVTSSGFAGGDSVDVHYMDGVPTEQVKKEISQFQQGHFDGMTDSCDYSSSRKDIPQTKYLMIQRGISQENRDKVIQNIIKEWGMIGWSDEECRAKCGMCATEKIWKETQKLTF